MATQVLDWPSVYGSLTDSDKRNIRQVLTDEEYATLWFEQPSMVLPLEQHVLMVMGRGRGKSTRLAKTVASCPQRADVLGNRHRRTYSHALSAQPLARDTCFVPPA